MEKLPFELMLAICAQLRRCSCTIPENQAFSLGCTGNHPPGAFGSTELSVLRQTSRKWRAAALNQGLSQLVVSNRWMCNTKRDRLLDISKKYSKSVRKIVFRSSDYYQGGPRRSTSGELTNELEAVLAMGWPYLEAVAVEWFSGNTAEHTKISAAVRRYAPRIRELYIRDKLASFTRIAPLYWGHRNSASYGRCTSIRRLAIKPYGYNQHWSALMPSESGAAEMLCGMPGQLTSLAVGGSDLTPELLYSLQNSQPNLKYLSVEHAWTDAFGLAAVCLPQVTSLHLSIMFPKLRTLSVRHVWRHADRRNDERVDSARGAVSLQNEQWLSAFLMHEWPSLRTLSLPAITDLDTEKLPAACPNLVQLVTYSLDYSGPHLSAFGLVNVLHGLKRLRHLSIEQRRADGSPGYEIMDAAMCRLMGTDDEDVLFTDRMLRRTSTTSSILTPTDSPTLRPQHKQSSSLVLDSDTTDVDSDIDEYVLALRNSASMPTKTTVENSQKNSQDQQQQVISKSLNTLYIPRASFTASTLDALVGQLPNLVKLSASLRSDSFFSFNQREQLSSVQKPKAHQTLKWIAVSADEDILTDPQWLSAWLTQRFPKLQECSTNHARSHKRMIAELREAAPAIKFTRLNSRALQTTCN
ncbi:hypothetical protein BX070DRAFT_236480 [Coemansia spiralis]|nr:hypothetical protein BX070DRAFT_236480 [Coemansia spiralis]